MIEIYNNQAPIAKQGVLEFGYWFVLHPISQAIF